VADVIWTDEALDQLDLIVSSVGVFDATAAERLRRRLFILARSLSVFPDRGRPLPGGRRELVTIAPYLLRYRVIGDTVAILSVRHGARRPD
jgi:toxin ParE1/3/4